MKIKMVAFILLLLFYGTRVLSQTYEIRAVNRGSGFVGVEMRITAGTPPAITNLVTDLVFGIKWPASYNVDLLTNTITTSYNIVKSDVRKQKSEFYYQAFSAEKTPFAFPGAWTLNQWVDILSVRNTLTGNGFGTFEITETGFDLTTDPNFGVDLIDYRPAIVGSASNVLLPVNLTRFAAAPVNKAIQIQWTTTYERNFKGFEVERSQKEITDFQGIGWMDSKGNVSSNNYEFIDKEVAAGVKYYYRLKQVNLDNKFTYSTVQTAMLKGMNNNAVRIMPNPADRVLKVFFDNNITNGTVMLKVVDAKGAIVLTKNHFMDAGKMASLVVTSLTSGQYFLLVEKDKDLLYSDTFQKK